MRSWWLYPLLVIILCFGCIIMMIINYNQDDHDVSWANDHDDYCDPDVSDGSFCVIVIMMINSSLDTSPGWSGPDKMMFLGQIVIKIILCLGQLITMIIDHGNHGDPNDLPQIIMICLRHMIIMIIVIMMINVIMLIIVILMIFHFTDDHFMFQ